MSRTILITTTVYLALMGYHPAMDGQQQIAVVWVNTPRDAWTDDGRALARSQIRAALDWWEVRADVAFATSERAITTTVDVLSLNACTDRSWLTDQADGPSLYLIAYKPTYRALTCDGVVVGDAGVSGDPRIAVSGYLPESSVSQAIIAHTVAHLYGARDTHDPPSGDLMDRTCFVWAYEQGIVADQTWAAIGATRRAPSGAADRAGQIVETPGRRPARGHHSQEMRESYLYERSR